MTDQDKYRQADGSNNNLANPDWGSAGDTVTRLTDSAYGDGISTPAGDDRPGAISISDTVFAQDEDLPNSLGTSAITSFFGQFFVHDTDLVETNPADVLFVPGFAFPLSRSVTAEGTGAGTDTPAQQVNSITAYIDLSTVYGSSDEQLAGLRAFESGKLAMSDGDLMPVEMIPGHGGEESAQFIAGDPRANENPILASLHTVWVRHHNLLAEELAAQHPDWDDEQLFQEARILNEAVFQKVAFEEWLPELIGGDALGDYQGYDETVHAQVSTEALTAALRVGHTLIPTLMPQLNEDGSEAGEALSIRDQFFNTEIMLDKGIDGLLRGVTATPAQEVDAKLVDDLRQLLDLGEGQGKQDLAAINIMRGRDHGLGSYVDTRAQLSDLYGLDLPPIETFSDITSDPEVAAALEAAYGTVDKIDLWVGGLAEDAVEGSQLGVTFQTIIVLTMNHLRHGDRFWYEARLDGETLAQIEATTFADILTATTGIDHLQQNVFQHANRIGGTDRADQISGTDGDDLIIGFEGNDTLVGGLRNDSLYGDGGRDTLVGEEGDDLLDGGKGRDGLYGGDGDDRLRGGDGNDALHGDAGDDWLEGDRGHDTLIGNQGDDHLYGGDGNDALMSGEGDDHLDGGRGRDDLCAGDGNDELKGGRGNDRLWGEGGDDRLWGGHGNDLLHGGTGDDSLSGGHGHDTLYGEDGDDVVHGLGGNDGLYGGDGADRFVFKLGDDHDRIGDFDASEGDVIDLRGACIHEDGLAGLFEAGAITALDEDTPWKATLIDVGDNNILRIDWVAPDHLQEEWFLF